MSPATKWKSVQHQLMQMVKDGLIDVVGKRSQASVYAVSSGSGDPDPSGPPSELVGSEG